MIRKVTPASFLPVLLLYGAIVSTRAIAGTSAFYSCQSAETDPNLSFSVTLREHDHPPSADVVATFPKASPSVARYDHLSYLASASGADHVAYEGEGISIVVYPDPKMISTVVFGDQGGAQAGLAMHCRPDASTVLDPCPTRACHQSF